MYKIGFQKPHHNFAFPKKYGHFSLNPTRFRIGFSRQEQIKDLKTQIARRGPQGQQDRNATNQPTKWQFKQSFTMKNGGSPVHQEKRWMNETMIDRYRYNMI